MCIRDRFWGAFINTGQTCAALKRLYVPDSIYDEVVTELSAFAAQMPMGVGLEEQNVLGPLQNEMPVSYTHLDVYKGQVYARANFATKQLWGTQYAENEVVPAGMFPSQSSGWQGLPTWTKKNRSLDGEDLVLWHQFGPTHFPRTEDWPVMPVDYSGSVSYTHLDVYKRQAHTSLELINTMLSAILDVEHTPRNPHEALLQKIYSYIGANLGSSELSPGSIAAAHYISIRHLHALFAEHDTTVSTVIKQRRLEHARADLTDASMRGRTVAAIATRWGFVDAAHFSRVFKQSYGISPSELRAL